MEKTNITILTGAGVSAESGIPTFRDTGGFWEKYRIEDVATPDGFERDPNLVHEFYNKRRQQLLSGIVSPNAAHEALAKLEKEFPGEVCVVTQNIDNLHELAGSENVIHMHGELLKSRCHFCGRVQECKSDLSIGDVCPSCLSPGGMRPHVVWFGEVPLYMPEIEMILMRTNIFIAIGTSGVVYPASGFVAMSRQYDAETIEINLEPTEVSGLFDKTLVGKASEEVPKLVEELLQKGKG